MWVLYWGNLIGLYCGNIRVILGIIMEKKIEITI